MQRRGWLRPGGARFDRRLQRERRFTQRAECLDERERRARAPRAHPPTLRCRATPRDAAFEQPDVRCGFPDVDGPSIALLSTPSGLVFRIRVQQGKVTILVTDDATPSHERDFTGSGVSTFDPATGAHVDSTLTEVPNAAGAGDIGQSPRSRRRWTAPDRIPEPRRSRSPVTRRRAHSTNAALESARRMQSVGQRSERRRRRDHNGVKEFIELGLRPDGISVNKMSDSGSSNYISAPGAATVTDTGASRQRRRGRTRCGGVTRPTRQRRRQPAGRRSADVGRSEEWPCRVDDPQTPRQAGRASSVRPRGRARHPPPCVSSTYSWSRNPSSSARVITSSPSDNPSSRSSLFAS